jgi:hypothetical protein
MWKAVTLTARGTGKGEYLTSQSYDAIEVNGFCNKR